MHTYFAFVHSILFLVLLKTVHAQLYEPSVSPSEELNTDHDTIILDSHIIYPKKISIGETRVVLSMGGSFSLFSFLYYYCLIRKRRDKEKKSDNNDWASDNDMVPSHSYTLGIASPSSSDSWMDRGFVSSSDPPEDETDYLSRGILMGSFPITLETHFKSTDAVTGKSQRNKRSVTFSGVDTGWAKFDEEVGCRTDLSMIEEDEVENEGTAEV
jgi:hypothetical protein